jgi:hypothetical protein
MTTVDPEITLEELPPRQSQTKSSLDSASARDDDPILQASHAADSDLPEGGYGWVVVGGCAVIAWWVTGTTYAWGVVQGALVDEGVSSPAVLSFVGSLATSLLAALAIVNSRVLRSLGPQRTGVLSILCLSIAELSSSFAVTKIGGFLRLRGR